MPLTREACLVLDAVEMSKITIVLSKGRGKNFPTPTSLGCEPVWLFVRVKVCLTTLNMALIWFDVRPFAEGENLTEHFEMWQILNVIYRFSASAEICSHAEQAQLFLQSRVWKYWIFTLAQFFWCHMLQCDWEFTRLWVRFSFCHVDLVIRCIW